MNIPLIRSGETVEAACRRVTTATQTHSQGCECAACGDVLAFYVRGYVLTPHGVVSPWAQYV
jgi:hypothetical protein